MSNCSSQSCEHGRVVREPLAGQLDRLTELIQSSHTRLCAFHRAELQAALDFNRGALTPSGQVGIGQRVCFELWVGGALGRAVLLAALHILAAFASAVGARERVFERLRLSLGPMLVHHRYTNFLLGLTSSLALAVFAPKADIVSRAYYGGMLGMFECLAGRFDLGLPSLDAAYEALDRRDAEVNAEALVDADLYERLMTLSVVRALYLSYAGRQAEAHRQFDRVLERSRTTAPYALIEIFLCSVRIYTNVEELDPDALTETCAMLKRLLRSHFRGIFSLRAAISAGLIASIKGDVEAAHHHLAVGEGLLDEVRAAIEITRYHCLCALACVETSELAAARHHALLATGSVANLPGARFHQADALLLQVEVRVRSALRAGPLGLTRAERRDIEREIGRAERLVRGSLLFDARRRALRLFERFLSNDFAGQEDELAQVQAIAREASPRIAHVLSEIDTRTGRKITHGTGGKSSRQQWDLTILDRFRALVSGEAGPAQAQALLSLLAGAETCEVQVEPSNGNDVGSVRVEQRDATLEVSLNAAGQRHRFILQRPLIDPRFDSRAAQLVRLAAEVIQLSIERTQIEKLQRRAAAVRTTQMLAHDLRRPFASLKSAMNAISSARSATEVTSTVAALMPEVQRAARVVSDLLDDVVDLGAERVAVAEPVLPELLIGDCITETLRMPEVQSVSVDYALAHERALSGDKVRIRRVLSNLLANAVQAMHGRGNLWLYSRDVDDFVEIVIGNSGPPIAEDDLTRIFEVFYTKGKPGGTGLGLAVAQHVVSNHGGDIACRNTERGVEFVFRLPAAEKKSSDRAALTELRERLPRSDVDCRVQSLSEEIPGLPSALGEEERRAYDRITYLGQPLDLLLIDPDRARAAEIVACVERHGPPGKTRVSLTTGFASALAVARERPPGLAILATASGSDDAAARVALQQLRELNPQVLVCSLRATMTNPLPAEVDCQELTPLTPERVLRLLAAASERQLPRRTVERRALVALVDDSRAHQLEWQRALRDDALLRFYQSPDAFWQAANREPDLLERLDVVVVDYIFLDSEETGVGFARALKRKRSNLPILLSTSGCTDDEELEGAVDGVLEKAALSWPALVRRIDASQANSTRILQA